MVDVPNMDEFNDLVARVEALEGSVIVPPDENQPTPDGTYITQLDEGPIVDDALNEYELDDANIDTKGYQIVKNGVLDNISNQVVILGINQRRIVQQNQQGNWYADNNTGTAEPPSWTQIADPTVPPQPNKGGIYQVRNGKVYAPDGSIPKLRGPNLRLCNWPDNQNIVMGHAISNTTTCTPLLTTFPGTTLVRFDAFESMAQIGVASLDNCRPFIDSMVAKGIVVEVECHVYPTVLSGGDLDRVCDWYSQFASHYKGVPEVIWGTQNEPGGNPDNEISRIYDAIRNTGNENLILMCPEGGWTWQNMNKGSYSRYVNVAWDFHFYGWMPGYSQDQGTVDAKLRDMIGQGMTFYSADGPIPSFCGEFGVCGFQGDNAQFVEGQFWFDPNGFQVIDAVYRSKELCGWMQWFWNTPETSQSNGISFLIKPDGNYNGSAITDHGGVQLRNALAT